MILSWNTTNECNLYCSHCYRESGDRRAGELNTAEGKKLIDEIARAGFKVMIFSGGEPLMREDIYELIAHAAQRGLRPVLGSNGTLITEEAAQKLKEAGARGVGISLDSLDRCRHDKLRGCEHAWDRAVQGMENCKKAGLPFQIHTTIMDWNAPELEQLTDFAVERGAVAHHIFFLVPTGRGKDIADEALDPDTYEEVLTRAVKKAAEVNIEIKPTCAPQFMRIAKQLGVPMRFGKGCIAGTSYCIIGPTGRVQPCAYISEEIGNVRETPFDEIWRDNPVFHRLRTAAYEGACGACAYQKSCGGCRARAAYYHDGNLMAEDIICQYGQRGR
ncbi:putative heme d1 biosynthesis radical SAM protein NirJ2 [Ligaoa zhengdingensis]|uniref:putative heme d1 biosynthesis radical SAM protein NirJ2 n=1 Tax=Ligaoa zhengdingensis TaxID=2763658 RepID=UPI0031B9DD64